MKDIHPCPECGHKEWKESEIDCEDCGTHCAVECINCGEKWDGILNDEIYDAVCKSYGVKDSWDIKN